ncbi:MAG: hypothetical protein NC343_00625 [Muribaculum sp.]|nr:hypothetical protein [Muribaculaceae bacterium]MCM1080239.1 hypothetical protein [Muribaculum sp.]
MKHSPAIIIILAFLASCLPALCCTSAIISGKCTPDGRPLLWKNRDTGTLLNFVDRVDSDGKGSLAYVALFNDGDSLRSQAWIGMNEASFAIMNTASYNLAPDTATVRDREGFVMAKALASCRSLADFERLLNQYKRPIGVQANFGVVDTNGDAAFYETCDTGFVKFPLSDSPTGLLIRTNFSQSGDSISGFGYIRYANATHLINPAASNCAITPAFLIDTVSCSFYHSLLEADMLADTSATWIVDQDFIPRYSTSASIAIAGKSNSADNRQPIMWCALGYPPCAPMQQVTLNDIPAGMLPDPKTTLAPDCVKAMQLKDKVFPITRGSGQHYIYLPALRSCIRNKQHVSSPSKLEL